MDIVLVPVLDDEESAELLDRSSPE